MLIPAHRTTPRWEVLDALRQLKKPLVLGGANPQERDLLVRAEREHAAELGFDAVGAGQVGLVQNDDVGDFEQPRLFPLDVVTGFGLNQENDAIDLGAYGCIPLPRADRLHENEVETKSLQELSHEIEAFGDGPLS